MQIFRRILLKIAIVNEKYESGNLIVEFATKKALKDF